MKSKPLAHKDENTFKFQTFNERLSNINVDVIHRIGKTSQVPEDTETFFLETLQKWNDLNYTDDFEALVKEIGYDIQSLPQLVHRQEEIVQILLQNLSNPNSLALDATFELLVALARDLQFDFYPYFPQFFEILVKLLVNNDAKLLEQVFTTLAYLFKFLWRYMLKDIEDIYSLYSPLFNHKKEYIRNFSAESFAFLMRKAPEKDTIFLIIFQNLDENPKRVVGIGQLFFQMMKGVKQQFHSSTEMTFSILLKLIWSDKDDSIESNLKVTAVLHASLFMCQHAGKEYTGVLWKVFCSSLSSLCEKRKTNASFSVDNHIAAVLTILNSFVEFKDTILLLKPAQIMNALNSILSLSNLHDDCAQILLEVAASLLCSRNATLESDIADNFINSVFQSYLTSSHIFNFAEQLFDYNRFEIAVLPNLLSYCNDCLSNNIITEALTVITSLIVHKNGNLSVESTVDEKPNELDFRLDESDLFSKYKKKKSILRNGKTPLFKSEICKILNDISLEQLTNLPPIWASLICAPHVGSTDMISNIQNIVFALQKLLITVTDDIKSTHFELYAYILAQSLSACYQIDKESLFKSFDLSFFLEILKLNPSSTCILYIFNLYRRAVCTSDDTEFTQVLHLVLPNLSSPYHNTRLLALRILASYELQLPVLEDDDDNKERLNVFQICLAAEEVPLTVQDSRKKLVLLQKLDYDQVQSHLPVLECELVPVHYLIGMLYVNFQLLWKPVQQYLDSQARGLGKMFWTVFLPHLQKSAEMCENVLQGIEWKPKVPIMGDSSPLGELISEQMSNLCIHEDLPDWANHRLLLWQAIRNFADVAEARNREIVTLFLQFLDKEYFLMDSTICKTENISHSRMIVHFAAESKKKRVKKRRGHFRVRGKNNNLTPKKKAEELKPTDVTITTVDNDKELDKANIDEFVMNVGEIPKRKATSKTLAAHLAVFSKFKNPKAVFKEPAMYRLYLELLTHKDEAIQKLAFSCVMTYNHEYLLPYKANFQNLLDDKTFKTEVVLFSIDSEHGIVEKVHRAEVLPILMRVLYGKMLRKTGSNSSGKSNAQFRRSIVLRFLAGCKETELKIFLQLVFLPFIQSSESTNVLDMVKTIRNSIEPTLVIPIRRQLSILNTLGTVFTQIGSLIKSLLPWLLKVLLSLLSTASALLEKRDEINSMYIHPLKALRIQAVHKLIQFFQLFDHYQFTKDEIDGVFEAAIWPMLPRLEMESLISPSPLLKLLFSWSENPRWFVLLGKHHPENANLCPLDSITKLYTSDKVQHGVVVIVSTMIENLLTTRDYDPDDFYDEDHDIGPVLEINNGAKVSLNKDNLEQPNYGTSLLIPYVSRILFRLQALVDRTVKNPKKLLSSMELNILSRISEYITDPTQSSALTSLLIPFLTKTSRRNEEVEIATLSCIRNLIFWADKPSQFLKSLAPLFSLLTHRASRSGLCAILSGIADRDKTHVDLAKTVLKLNAWHPKMMEEPDYNTRLDGFKIINEWLETLKDDIDVEFLLIAIYNCTYYVRTTDDTALRDNASHTLQHVSEKLSFLIDSDINLFRFVTFEHFLSEIQKGLRNSTELVRHEFISIFASLLRTCGRHPRLSGLAKLCNPDRDVDFWENIRNIQMHRRARSLRRLSNEITDGTITFPPYIFTSYLLPLTTSFLTNADYLKHSNLVDAAIELYGALCSCLPWNRYETTLKYYLGQITKNNEFHKTNIKIIVAILDNFHFDLSKSEGLTCNLKEPPKAKPCIESNEAIIGNVEDEVDEDQNDENDEDANATNNKIELDVEKATKIHQIVARNILPKLHSCLNQKARTEDEHKLAKKNYAEDEEILRVPIAIAMVKLLQNLPKGMIEQHLPGVFLRMVQFLRSRADSIRDATRDTLLKIMSSLGPAYLWFLLKEMRGVMKRGYQVHVMMFTVHSILSSLVPRLSPGDLDSCIESLTELCVEELFGEVAEEKEVDKIVGKLKEARSSKSYSTFQILSQFTSAEKLQKLITPLKNVLSTTHSHKSVRKVQECLRHAVLGLSDNKSLTASDYLIFSHSLVSNFIQAIDNSSKKKNLESTDKPYKRPDIYLIPEEPKRGGVVAKTSVKTNAHVLLEFGLQILHFCLKREIIIPSNQEHLEMLDPFVTILNESLSSLHMKVISTALRCLAWIVKFPLPSLKSEIVTITNCSFVLLNKYCGAGMGQGDNFEMVVMCFKLLTVIVRDIEYHKITDEQLKVLLVYIDQDIHDNSRQATAFTLLKAILSRSLNIDELSQILLKIQELSVISEQEHIRMQCRHVFLQYLLEYPHPRTKLERLLSFYVVQLEYECESGRESATEMLNSLVNSFPEKLLSKYSGMFMIPMAARLVNEESPKSRKFIATTLRNLLTKLTIQKRTKLFSVVNTWLSNNKLSHKRLGVQLSSLFAEVEKDTFVDRFKTIMPMYASILEPKQYNEIVTENSEKITDHLVYHTLNSFLKILNVCGYENLKAVNNECFKEIWQYTQKHLLHPHNWVRLISAQLFGLLFAQFKANDLVLSTVSESENSDFLLSNTRQKLRDLSADFCAQLKCEDISEVHGEQIVRNLVFLAKVISTIPDISENCDESVKVSLNWMLQRLSREAKAEVVLQPKNTIKRTCIFKWFAAISLDMVKDVVQEKLSVFLPLLCRELSDQSVHLVDLRKLAQEVCDLLKGIVGIEVFSRAIVAAQATISAKKAKRKIEKATEVINNPEISARKKIKSHMSKQEQKKRKFESFKKNKVKVKRSKLSDIAMS